MDLRIALIALAPALGAAAAIWGARVARQWRVEDGLTPVTGEGAELGWPATIAAAALGLAAACVALWAFDGWLRIALAVAIAFAFLFSATVDLNSRLLPDWPTAAATLAGLVLAYVDGGWWRLGMAALGALAAGGAFYAVAWFFRRRLGRDALGWGDIKLAAAGGALLGPAHVWLAISAGAAATAALALALTRLRGGALERQHEIPFGPGLMAAIWVSWAFYSAPIAVPSP